MAKGLAVTVLRELRDPHKQTHNYLSSVDGEFSWGNTTEEEHKACLGMMATNDIAESPFGGWSQQVQQFGRLLGIHASARGIARMNKDFTRNIKQPSNNGLFHKLSPHMKHSLITFALSISQERQAKAERML